ELDTETTYLYDRDQWIVDRVNEINVYSGLSTFKGTVFVWTGNQLTAVRNKTAPQFWVETSMTYNANGLPERVTEPPTTDQLTRTTTFVYDDTFHAYPKTITYPQTVTNGSPVTHIVQKAYRPDGQLESVTDENGNVTTLTYDSLKRLAQESRTDGG